MPEEKKNEVIKEEVETVNEKLQELTPEELEQVTGGIKLEFKSGGIYGIVGSSGTGKSTQIV